MQLDLGSVVDIAKIILKSKNLSPHFIDLWQLSGVVLQILDNSSAVIGEYNLYECKRIYNIGSTPRLIKTNTWITSSSDPASLFYKWDAQEVDSIIGLDGYPVTKSESLISKIKEKSNSSMDLMTNNDVDACKVKFVVDSSNYPSIALTYGSGLQTSGSKTVYYDKTYFMVFMTTDTGNADALPFVMGTLWRAPYNDNNYLTGFTQTSVLLRPSTNAVYVMNQSSTAYCMSLNSELQITDQKKVVFGFSYDFVNSTTLRISMISSSNPNTIKYSQNSTITSTEFRTNYTNIDCRYHIGGRPNAMKEYGTIVHMNSMGDQYWPALSGNLYEFNIHNQLSEAQLITECNRLMTKWGIS